MAFAALLAAAAAALLLASPLDGYRRWGAAGGPGQELVFSGLLVALLLLAAVGCVAAWPGRRRARRPLSALVLGLAPAHLLASAAILVVAWYGELPAPRGERLMVAAWLAVGLLGAAGAAIAAAAPGGEGVWTRWPGAWRALAPVLLGSAGGLILFAAIAGLPWSVPRALGVVGSTAVLLDLGALVGLQVAIHRRFPVLVPGSGYLLAHLTARLLGDAATALAGGLHEDLFTIGQLAALASLGALVLGTIRHAVSELELGAMARARLAEVERQLVDERAETASRGLAERWTRELLRNLLKAVEAMRIGLTVASPQGRIVYVNPADAELHGWDRKELLGQPASVYAPSSLADDARSANPQPWMRETENVTRQGERFPVRLHSDVVRDDAGEVVALVTLCEDIRDELRVKAALQRRERVLEVVEVATERFLRGGLQPDHEAEVLAGLRRAAGVERAHLTRLVTRGAVYARQAAEEEAAAAGAGVGAGPAAVEAALRRLGRRLPPGAPWFGRVSDLEPEVAAPLREAGIGSLAGVPASVGGERWAFLALSTRDVEREWSPVDVEALEIAARILGAAEESEQARLALHASEARYRAVVESASDLIQSVDQEGRVRFVNEAWANALGWSREEAVGLSIWEILDPAEHEHCRERFGRVMAGESQSNVVTTLRTRDGGRLRVEGNVTLQLEGGRPVAALAILRNISERDRLARMRDEFIATVSHELRTPLTSMLGALSLLRGRRLDGHEERRRELTEVAVRNGERLLRLVNELLDIQRLEAGRLRVHVVTAEMVEILEEAGNGVAALAEGKSVRLQLASEPELRVRCDRERLVQVLFNLLSNAIKFSPNGGEVWARAQAAAAAVEIEVVDRGPGIPPEFRRQLFEPFTQADSGSARSAGGSGLGLFISRRLVEAMAGGIRVEQREGGGTRVVVTVPLAGETTAAAV